MPSVDDGNYEEDFVGGAPSPIAKAKQPAASPRSSSKRLTFKGLEGVSLPAAALHPQLVVTTDASGEERHEHTLIVTRSKRGVVALQERNAEPSAAQMALRDFSHFHPPEVKSWNKEYLDELAYAETSKKMQEEKRERERAIVVAEEKARALKFAHKDESGESFVDRQDAMTKRLEETRANVAAEFEYKLDTNHMVCPKCKAPQGYQDWKNGFRRCPKAECGGAIYGYKYLWADVQQSFLGRWKTFGIKMKENLEKLDKETLPPFKLLSRKVCNKETGETEELPIEYLPWEDVQEHFFERQQECLDKLEARRTMAEEEAKKMATKLETATLKALPYKFSKPLPDFYTRQAQSLEAKNRTFDERFAEMQG